MFAWLSPSKAEEPAPAAAAEAETLPPGVTLHSSVWCDGCSTPSAARALVGKRFKCLVCPNVDLCQDCFSNSKFPEAHDVRARPCSSAAGFRPRQGARCFSHTAAAPRASPRPLNFAPQDKHEMLVYPTPAPEVLQTFSFPNLKCAFCARASFFGSACACMARDGARSRASLLPFPLFLNHAP